MQPIIHQLEAGYIIFFLIERKAATSIFIN